MKLGKATSPDSISVDLLEALEDYEIDKDRNIYSTKSMTTGQNPPKISKSIFIALPKKPGTTECELHSMISLMSQITKILLRIIMMQPYQIESEIARNIVALSREKVQQMQSTSLEL